ncbi:MAG TPA: IS701 family transposase [Kribbellaceae bacterium]|nr:IS701 family transposase [Kribbellaceae bacterium]
MAGRFGRAESRRQARAYLTGLLAPVERKNAWQLAQAAGDPTPDRMQRLLSSARWDPDLVRDDLRAYVAERLGHRDGVLVVNETGFAKRGHRSAGVQRQRSGAAGPVENCQVGVFLAYAAPAGRALIDRELYLPRSWTEDRSRCVRAGIPETVTFAAKPALATTMVGRALDAGVPASWVIADEAYGADPMLRAALDQRRIGYVLAVAGHQPIRLGNGTACADAFAGRAPDRAWKRLAAGSGEHERPTFEWAMATLPGSRPDRPRALLIRRSRAGDRAPAFYLCAGPAGARIDTLAAVATTGSATEDYLRRARTEAGLDQYQVRRYGGWYRHITLAMVAHAYLAVTAAAAQRTTTVMSSNRNISIKPWCA